ncbi:MAG: LysR family transcriptional regulator [Beijerinckiaceae bacterium]
MPISIRQLRLFQAVAHAGHVTNAAQQMNLTQPAVSHQLRQLEAELGYPLFIKSGRRLVLTGEGEALVAEADAAIADFDAMLRRIRKSSAADIKGQVRIAALQSYNQTLVVDLAVRLRKTHPGIRITGREMAAHRISAAVAAGEADIGLSFQVSTDQSLRAQSLSRERLIAISNEIGTARRHAPMTFAELACRPLALMPPEFRLRALVENCAADHKVQINVVFESSNHLALIDFARATGAVAIVPQSIAEGLSGMHCLELAVPIEREVSLIVRRGALSDATTCVIEELMQTFRSGTAAAGT